MAEMSGFDQWLSLGDASALLGVHASTLRRWADSGRVPCQRTPGGHRRFNRPQLLQSLEGAQQQEPPAEVPVLEEQPWYRQLAAAGFVDDLRVLGQRISGISVQHLLRRGNDQRYLEEAHAIGTQVAAMSRTAGVTLAGAIAALVYFRATLVPVVAQMAVSDVPSCAQQLGRHEQLMNQVMLGLVAGFED